MSKSESFTSLRALLIVLPGFESVSVLSWGGFFPVRALAYVCEVLRCLDVSVYPWEFGNVLFVLESSGNAMMEGKDEDLGVDMF